MSNSHSGRIPTLRFHKKTKQWYFWDRVKRGRVYLGREKDPAQKRYAEIIAQLVAKPAPAEPLPKPAEIPSGEVTVSRAVLLWYEHRERTVSKTSPNRAAALSRSRQAVKAVMEKCGTMPAVKFRGKALEEVQTYLIGRPVKRKTKGKAAKRALKRAPRFDPAQPICRTYINMLHRQILLCWSWLVKEEIVPADNLAVMREVPFLREQEGVRESDRVTPAMPEHVADTLNYCHPTLASMILIQQLTGMRPGELCAMRKGDISTTPEEKVTLPKTTYQVSARLVDGKLVWLYVPSKHKTLGKRKIRIVLIGPRAQAVLAPLLVGRSAETHVFNPREAVAAWREVQRANRKTKVQPSQIDRSNGRPKIGPSDRYTSESYARAVLRTIDRANEERKARGLPEIPPWSPNRLRHAMATEVAEKFDDATAAALLGHSGTDVIKIYAEQAIQKGATAAKEIG